MTPQCCIERHQEVGAAFLKGRFPDAGAVRALSLSLECSAPFFGRSPE